MIVVHRHTQGVMLYILLTSVFVAKRRVDWGHEDRTDPAGLAWKTAATRLGAETSGLETNTDRRPLVRHVGSREPMADAWASRSGGTRRSSGCRLVADM